MGNTFCTRISGPSSESRRYLDNLTSITRKYRGVTGGGDSSKFGGYSSLENYGNSMFSKAKEELIRSIAKDVANVLKISDSFADKADLKDVIAKFTKVVPNPRQGRKIKVSKKIHDDVCKKIAKSINKNYKSDLINLDAPAEHMCREISEVLYSLFTGIHTEFLTVAADVSRIMNNLNHLQSYIDGIHNKLINDLSQHEDGESQQVKEAYNAISREIKRQHTYLTNLSTGVIGPTGKSIISLIEENDEFSGLTKDLEALSGSREFSDKLSYMMSGTSSVAHAAYLVDKALKELGLGLADYKKTKDIKSTRKMVYDKLVKLKPSSKNITKLLSAAEVLYRNDLSHDDIVDHLSKHAKKGGDTFAELVSDGLYRDSGGVYEGRKYANKGSIKTQIHNKKVQKRKLLGSLNSEIKRSYNRIVNDLSKISKNISSGSLKDSDKMHRFIRQMGYLESLQPDRTDLVKALSGVNTNALSRYVKDDFVNSLNTVILTCEEMSSGNMGQHFKSLASSLSELVSVITNFNNTFTKALTEIHVSTGKKTTGAKEGGNPMAPIVAMESMAYRGGADDFKYISTLKKAIRELEYYFKIANIKKQLNSSKSTSDDYKKNYENIIGEECGLMIDKINALSKALVCEDKTVASRLGSTIRSTSGYIGDVITPDYINCKPYTNFITNPNDAMQKASWNAYKFTIEYIRSAKVEMIEAAQALDLYLSKFTEHVQTNPDAIKDYVKLLEQLEVVSKWFTEKSGDNLVRVFENHQRANALSINGSTNHYYQVLKDSGAGAGVGMPTRVEDGIPLVGPTGENKIKALVIDMEKSLKSMRALENIIAIFSKINVGNEKIQTFMSKGLMFKVFMKYTVATSLAIGTWNSSIGGNNVTYTDVVKKYGAGGWPANLTRGRVTDATGAAPTAGNGGMGRVYLRKVNSHNNYGTGSRQKFFDPLELSNDDVMLSTDDIFEMCIKSMISKIFVVVGSFNLFHKPSKSYKGNNALSNSSLRQIMGGSSHVKIIPDATEAYIRLVLLAEWYRDVFEKLNQGLGATDFAVNMLPQFDGIWYDFTKVMFIDAANVSDGGYPNSLMQDIIKSINDIYTHYKAKYPTTTVTEIINAFVSEVNMRYGLIMKEQFDEYERERDTVDNNSVNAFNNIYEDDDDVDYDILDSELSDTRLTAPSDKFRKESSRPSDVSSLKTKKIHEKIKKFRRAVEDALKLKQGLTGPMADEGVFGAVSMKYSSVDDLIMQTKKRLSAIGNDGDRADKQYGVVQSMIMGVERYSDVDYDTMLMFHETVINPLTILYTVYKMLNTWNRFSNSLNMKDYFDGNGNIKPGGAVLSNIMFINGSFKSDSKYLQKNATNNGFKTTYAYFCNDGVKDDYFKYVNGNNIDLLFKDTIIQLQYLTADKNPLVELYFSGDGQNQYPMLNFKKIEEHCTILMANIKLSINKFRKVLPHSIISRYEKMGHDNELLGEMDLHHKKPNVVSTSYLQEHLFDRLFKNRYKGGLSDSNKSLKTIWQYCTKQTSHNLTPVIKQLVQWELDDSTQQRKIINLLENWTSFPIYAVGLSKQSALSNLRATKKVVEDIVNKQATAGAHKPSDLIYTHVGNAPAGTFTFNPAGAGGVVTSTNYMGFQGIYDGYLKTSGTPGENDFLSESDGIKSGRGAQGLIVKFNRILYNYITTFTDVSSHKIYLPLLEGFANGINSDEIMKGNAINDLEQIGGMQKHVPKFMNNNFYPKETSVVFATLARAIRNITTLKQKTPAGYTLEMAEDSLLNVAAYMKDTMTAYLPMFSKQLNIMMAMASMYRDIIEKTKFPILLALNNPTGGQNGVFAKHSTEVAGPTGSTVAPGANWPSNKKNLQAKGKNYFVTQLDFIIASCKSLQQCCDKVYKELADVPLYFETYKNSLADYENRNGILPLMPLSHTSHLLNNAIRIVDNDKITPTSGVMGGVGYKSNITDPDGVPEIVTPFGVYPNVNSAIDVFKRNVDNLIELNTEYKKDPAKFSEEYNKMRSAITTIGDWNNNKKAGIEHAITNEDELYDLYSLFNSIGLDTTVEQLSDNIVEMQNIRDDMISEGEWIHTGTVQLPEPTQSLEKAEIVEPPESLANILRVGALADTAANQGTVTNPIDTANVYNPLVNRPVEQGTSPVPDRTISAIKKQIQIPESRELLIKNMPVEVQNSVQYANQIHEEAELKSQELEDCEERLKMLNAQFRQINRLLSKEYEKTKTLEQKNKEQTAKINELEAEKEELLARIEELGNQIEKLSDTLKAYGAIILNYKAMLDEMKGETAKDKKTIADLKAELEKTKKVLKTTSGLLSKSKAKVAACLTYWVKNSNKISSSGVPTHPIKATPVSVKAKYNPTFGLPFATNGSGSSSFKFAYGTRGLLSDSVKPSVDLAPGVLGMLDVYNRKVGGASVNYDKKRLTDIFDHSVHLLRWATDYTYHKTYLGDNDLDKLTEYFIISSTNVNGHRNILQHVSCQTAKHSIAMDKSLSSDGIRACCDQFFIKTSNITNLIENDNYKHSLYRMLRCIVDNDKAQNLWGFNRDNLRIYNILDANIVPFNFHTLQSEIPLVNIFNYAYTFDQMVKEKFAVKYKHLTGANIDRYIELNPALGAAFNTSEDISMVPEDTIIRIMMYPSGKRYLYDYRNNVSRIMAGSTGWPLNRPKYLSDQLWNKVLLNVIYRNNEKFDYFGAPKPGSIDQPNNGMTNYHEDTLLQQARHMGFNNFIGKKFNVANEPLVTTLFPTDPADYAFNADNQPHTYVKSVKGSRMSIETVLSNPHPILGRIATNKQMSVDWLEEGYNRYNTYFIRYIEWFVHLHRTIRLLMRENLSGVSDVIVHQKDALDEDVTDYRNNNKFTITDFE